MTWIIQKANLNSSDPLNKSPPNFDKHKTPERKEQWNVIKFLDLIESLNPLFVVNQSQNRCRMFCGTFTNLECFKTPTDKGIGNIFGGNLLPNQITGTNKSKMKKNEELSFFERIIFLSLQQQKVINWLLCCSLARLRWTSLVVAQETTRDLIH